MKKLPEEEKFPENWSVMGGDEFKEFVQEVRKPGSSDFRRFDGNTPTYYNITSPSESVTTSGIPEFTLVTVDQLKEHYLKEKVMDKKIIAYKVIKEFPNQLRKYTVGEEIRKVGFKELFEIAKDWPEYFEPVYEPEFKVGDYVVIHTDSQFGHPINTVGKIQGKQVSSESYYVKSGDHTFSHNTKYLRHATSEEIKKWEDSLLPTIAGNKPKVYQDPGAITYGCTTLYTADIAAIEKLVKATTVVIGGTTITQDIISNIKKAMG